MIISNVNPAKLLQSFWDSNIITTYDKHDIDINSGEITGNLIVEFAAGTNMELVQQIIDTHDPTPLPLPLSEIEKLRLEQAQANSELIQLIMTMGGA